MLTLPLEVIGWPACLSRSGCSSSSSRSARCSLHPESMTEPRPPLSRPGDFSAFWSWTLRELEGIPPRLDCQPTDKVGALRLERFAFDSLGGARIRGYLLRWEDGTPRPLVVHSHGYGGQTTPMWSWAAAGLNIVGIDIRGHGASRGALPSPSRWGWVLTGIESPETHVLRGAVCDVLRASRMGVQLLGGAVTRIVLHGMSFAGGLVLMAQALDAAADLLVVAYPTFGWAEGRRFLARAGSAAEIERFLQRSPEYAAEDVMVVLRYFDPINFAGWVGCPTLVGMGMVDEVVPPRTVLAIAAHLGGRYEVMSFPVSHSELPEEREWEAFERRWITLACSGIPADFGSSGAAGERAVPEGHASGDAP